jgi:hypothetical protein
MQLAGWSRRQSNGPYFATTGAGSQLHPARCAWALIHGQGEVSPGQPASATTANVWGRLHKYL